MRCSIKKSVLLLKRPWGKIMRGDHRANHGAGRFWHPDRPGLIPDSTPSAEGWTYLLWDHLEVGKGMFPRGNGHRVTKRIVCRYWVGKWQSMSETLQFNIKRTRMEKKLAQWTQSGRGKVLLRTQGSGVLVWGSCCCPSACTSTNWSQDLQVSASCGHIWSLDILTHAFSFKVARIHPCTHKSMKKVKKDTHQAVNVG